MVTINVVSCHISAVYGRILKIPKATWHALSFWMQLYRFPILELTLGMCTKRHVYQKTHAQDSWFHISSVCGWIFKILMAKCHDLSYWIWLNRCPILLLSRTRVQKDMCPRKLISYLCCLWMDFQNSNGYFCADKRTTRAKYIVRIVL